MGARLIDPQGGRPATPTEREVINALKDRYDAILALLQYMPQCRETSLAITNLEQSSMWATRGVIQGQPQQEEEG